MNFYSSYSLYLTTNLVPEYAIVYPPTSLPPEPVPILLHKDVSKGFLAAQLNKTYRYSENTREHGENKCVTHRIPTPGSLAQIQVPVDGSVGRDTAMLIIPARRIRNM